MTALVVVICAALALQGLLVVGLLRSHGEILRQLHELGGGRGDVTPRPVDLAVGGTTGSPALDLAGQTPGGEVAAVAVAGTGHDTLLAFLSSGCLTCAGFWDALGVGRDRDLPQPMRVVAVTKSPGDESESAVRKVAAAGVTVIMSTQAWLDYQIPGSPYFVHVSGPASRVVGEGTATSWEQVVNLVGTARQDGLVRRAGMNDHVDDLRNGARIDQELSSAGIGPGDPRLYPTAPAVSEGEV